MQYKITAVNPKTKTFTTQYGEMVSYDVMLEGMDVAVHLNQKLDTAPPEVGQVIEGTIDMSGQHGPKFKKAFGGGGNFSQRSQSVPAVSSSSAPTASGPTKGGPTDNSAFTFYLSYAKDILVAQMETGGFDGAKYTELLQAATDGGKYLFEHRVGAPEQEKQLDKVIEDVFGDPAKALEETELPWDKIKGE